MAEDNELEKRAIEELLKETDRARVRAETMGPAGWLKCPLGSTNKRFLLNTLRSTDQEHRSDRSRASHYSNRERSRSRSPERRRDRSRTPPIYHRSNGGRSDHKHHHKDNHHSRDKRRPDRDKDRHRDDKGRRHANGHNRDKDRQTHSS